MSNFISTFNIFSIGIGPSSSHTIGPMRAALDFVQSYANEIVIADSIKVELYGSLSLTGKGHGSDKAIILGLSGNAPENVDPLQAEKDCRSVQANGKIQIQGCEFEFREGKELCFMGKQFLDFHSNGMIFILCDKQGKEIMRIDYYSTGGGFILRGDKINTSQVERNINVKYPFNFCKELLAQCEKHRLGIPELMMENEKSFRNEKEIRKGLLTIWGVMDDSIQRGLTAEGILPGGLNVERRAAKTYRKLKEIENSRKIKASFIKDRISIYALAVNEENASGGRVVTAPTNGASGVIPAVLKYYMDFYEEVDPLNDPIRFLLTAGAIGNLYKKNASFSAAEVGCQGEIGVACSMAAGALAMLEGGTLHQIENAAEIGMEHHLGLTCDPIGGLVQIPCIERNTIASNTAVTACGLALMGEGVHKIDLDTVIETMLCTGKDMSNSYKETSQAGLALNTIEC